MATNGKVTVGFPRMHCEPNERRDFLPPLIGLLAATGAEVHVESGIGSGMGRTDVDYSVLSPCVVVTDAVGAYSQDIVVVLGAARREVQQYRRGAVLVSMLHFATRPARVRLLQEMGIDAVSLDLIRDDEGARLIENLRSVAWNGVAAAFTALERSWPELAGPRRSTVKVLIMGAGRVGRHAVESATKYGDDARNDAFARAGLPGVEVITAGRNLTSDSEYIKSRLPTTDILVDAAARRDPSRPLVPNALARAPAEARRGLRSVGRPVSPRCRAPSGPRHRGNSAGSLDQWEFAPDDPAWDRLPSDIPTSERRTVVSCYSWPGVRPEPCMHVYGSQLAPLLEVLVAAGTVGKSIRPGSSTSAHCGGEACAAGSPRAKLRHTGPSRYLATPPPSCNAEASRSVASLLKQRTRRTTR